MASTPLQYLSHIERYLEGRFCLEHVRINRLGLPWLSCEVPDLQCDVPFLHFTEVKCHGWDNVFTPLHLLSTRRY